MGESKTLRDYLINGVLKNRLFVDTTVRVYEVKDFEPEPDGRVVMSVRYGHPEWFEEGRENAIFGLERMSLHQHLDDLEYKPE